jgi:sigma-B regulation protein RsbU (phosphoserine phosphatase)
VRDLLQHRAAYLEAVVSRQTAELEAKNAALQERDRVREYHLELAGRIQRQVLPRVPPEFAPFSLALAYHPLEKVSGDGYDFALLDEDHLGILIADACGHGVPAAFVSVMARAIFHAFGRRGVAPSKVLRTMNDELPPLIEEQHFITMCFAVVERSTYRLTYASAGHPAPLWYHGRDGSVEPLAAHGSLIGVLDEPSFEDTTVQLRRGDAVLFYTDGVVDCFGEKGKAFGVERAAAAMRASAAHGAGAIIDRVEEELRRHAGPSAPPAGPPALADDATCIALALE